MTRAELVEAVITSLEGLVDLNEGREGEARARYGPADAMYWKGVRHGIEKAIAEVKVWRQFEAIRLPEEG